MGIRDVFSRWIYNQAEKRGYFSNVIGNSVRWGSRVVNSGNILESSDVYELISDISNQAVLAEPYIVDQNGKEIKKHPVLSLLKKPNDYLTGSEFAKLQINSVLLSGDAYLMYVEGQLHLVNGVYSDIDSNLNEKYSLNGKEIPGTMIEHIKNASTSFVEGTGILELGKSTLDGVLNAESILNDKYQKGGLLAFLLKIDSVINPQNKAQKIMIKSIIDQLDGASTSGSTKMIPLSKGFTIETLESPVDDTKIIEYLKMYKPDLGKFLGINVDTYQKLMSTDIEKAMMYLHNKVIKPYLKNLSEHYTNLLMKDSNLRIEWRLNTLDFVSYSTKAQIAYNQVRSGLMTPDDGAKILGLEPKNTAESTQLYISKDLVPLSMLKDVQNLKGGDNDENTGTTNVYNQGNEFEGTAGD